MTSRTLIAAFCTFALFASAGAEDLNKVAAQHEREFVKAMKTKDIKWFESVGAPDYHEIDMKGKVTDRAKAITGMKQMFASGKVDTMTAKVLSVTGSGNNMVVIMDAHMTGTMKFDPKAKKPSKVVGSMKFQESWSKTKGKWMIHELKSLSEKMTVDGKPYAGGM